MIVFDRIAVKGPQKKATQPALTVGRIVTHPHKYDRVRKAPEPDAEADARVREFLARMIRPVS